MWTSSWPGTSATTGPCRERVLPYLDAARARGAEVFLGDPGRPYVPHERLTSVATFDVPDTEGPQVRRTTVWRLP